MPPSFMGWMVPGSPTMAMLIEPPDCGEPAALGDAAPPAVTANARTAASPASCRGRIWELVDIGRLLLLIEVRAFDRSLGRGACRLGDRSIDAPAAIDNQRGTRHEAPSRAGQVDGGGGDLLG